MKNVPTSLTLSFDVGHASIGWAVVDNTDVVPKPIGTGSVVFRPDDCLNISRSGFRRSRRNIAARRNRIKHLKELILHLGLLSEAELNLHPRPHPFPWLLASQALSHGRILTWNELWSVLLWYAHNRGYDGNVLWTEAEQGEDTEKVTRARNIMEEHGTSTMAETICAYLGVDPTSEKNPDLKKYFKGENAAFPRDVIEEEVHNLLLIHEKKLKGLDYHVISCLLEDAKAIDCPAIRLPQRFKGGLLFGQMIPRFDNRIIPTCRITGEKTPSKHCTEFYRYRWGMLLANIRVKDTATGQIRPLLATERASVHSKMEEKGYLTKTELTKAVNTLANCEAANLETMFLIPEMEKALV